jgi:formylglycine-generating enzyme required for sulfatase activity
VWYGRRTGRVVRLPTREEWEKAARGTDGRIFPWGNRFDASFCKMEASREGRVLPEPIGSFAADESPYGVRDLAGTVQEWTASRYSEGLELRILCGSSWRDSHLLCRTTWYRGAPAAAVSLSYGFRLAVSL